MKKNDMKIGKLRYCIGGIGWVADGVGGTEPHCANHVHGRPGSDGIRRQVVFVHQSRRRRVNVVCHERMETVFHDRHGELDRPQGAVLSYETFSWAKKEMPGQCNAWNVTESFTLTFP